MADEDEEPRLLIRPLQFNDLPFLVALEQASFPPNEAATPEKVQASVELRFMIDYLSSPYVSRIDIGYFRS